METVMQDAEIETTTESIKPVGKVPYRISRQKYDAIIKSLQTIIERFEVSQTQLLGMLHNISDAADFSPEKAGNEVVKVLQKSDGGAWTSEELRDKWQLTPATLHKRRKDFRMVFWRDPQNHFYYPKWQFTEAGSLLPGISEVLQVFKSKDEWRIMRYFLGKRAQLDEKRPLDLLRQGLLQNLLEHAIFHANENTW
jgi:hypothetical protein